MNEWNRSEVNTVIRIPVFKKHARRQNTDGYEKNEEKIIS